MSRSEKLFLIGIVLFIIAGVWVYEHFFNNPIHYPLGKYKPIKNPHPKYFMTVRGNIDPRLRFPLTITAEYDSTNIACNVETNPMVGAINSRVKNLTYEAQPNQSGDFSLKIPLDYYLPGLCDWHITDIAYSFKKIHNEIFSFFDSNPALTKSYHLGTGKLDTSQSYETVLFSKNDYSYTNDQPFSDNLNTPLTNGLSFTLKLKKER